MFNIKYKDLKTKIMT